MDVVAADWGVCVGATGAVSGSTEAGLGGTDGPCTGTFTLLVHNNFKTDKRT